MSQGNTKQILQQQITGSRSGLLKPTTTFLTKETIPVELPVNEKEVMECTFSKMFPIRQVYISQKLPPEIGILYVFEAGEDCYQAIGGNAESKDILQIAAQRYPRLALGEMVTSHITPEMEMPETIRDLMTEFSYHQLDIRKWVKELKQRFGESLLLVIVDYTDAEVPWEMLEISPGKYLGAEITTARWQHIIGEDDHVYLEVAHYECRGKVLAYLNRTELKETQQEAAFLQKLHSVSYDDISKFREYLQQTESGFGLVYMACHGMFDQDVRRLALGAETNTEQRLTLMNLRRWTLNLLKESPSVVFINACHSGRLHQDDYRICARDRVGFAELFLGKGSRAVIGTLGGVSDEFAARIGKLLIEKVKSSPTVPLATILKNIRADAVNKLANNFTDENLLEFIYTFMYVYYGNPLLRLRLALREEKRRQC